MCHNCGCPIIDTLCAPFGFVSVCLKFRSIERNSLYQSWNRRRRSEEHTQKTKEIKKRFQKKVKSVWRNFGRAEDSWESRERRKFVGKGKDDKGVVEAEGNPSSVTSCTSKRNCKFSVSPRNFPRSGNRIWEQVPLFQSYFYMSGFQFL